MTLAQLIGKVGGKSPTFGRIFLDVASGGVYNDRRGGWIII